ncbi:MAG: hypothetical protein LBE75_05170 [Burkholderiales bacterium]|jgi:hypothetical protein|nr:hypothetical protein [Burkholderiales bacterium]
MRIRRAYCAELKRPVTADEARREFLSLRNRPEEFHFFCSSEACKSQGTSVRITCANYKNFAAEGKKFVTTYFRRWDDHVIGCCYYVPDNESNDHQQEQGKGKRRRKKETDLVDIFDPRPSNERQRAVNPSKTTINTASDEDEAEDDSPGSGCQNENLTRTIFLDKLVDTYEEAKQVLPKEEFFTKKIHLVGTGDVLLCEYFKPMSKAILDGEKKVYFGKARLEKRFGIGFRLLFSEKVNNLPVFLYVSSEALQKYKHKDYLQGMLDEASKKASFETYALGFFTVSPTGKSISIVINDLHHLTFLI